MISWNADTGDRKQYSEENVLAGHTISSGFWPLCSGSDFPHLLLSFHIFSQVSHSCKRITQNAAVENSK